MPIRAILFDLDGTLINQFQPIYKAFSEVISQMGYPKPTYEEVKKSIGGASESTMSKLIGKEKAKEAVLRLRPIFEKEMLNGLHEMPGAYEILKFCEINKLKAAVLTNKYGPHARAACEHLNFTPQLEFVLGANDTEWKKPDEEFTNLAIKKIGVRTEEVIYIGDSPYDYQTANNAKIKCHLVSTGTHTQNELSKSCKCSIDKDLSSLIQNRLLNLDL